MKTYAKETYRKCYDCGEGFFTEFPTVYCPCCETNGVSEWVLYEAAEAATTEASA